MQDSEKIIEKKIDGTNTTCEVVSTTLGDVPPGSYVVEVRGNVTKYDLPLHC